MKNEIDGMFEAIDGFAIRKRKEFYVIGKLVKGNVQAGWNINIPIGNTSFPMKISEIEEVEISSENKPYTLLILDCTSEGMDAENAIDLLLVLRIGSELLSIEKNDKI